MQLEDLVPGTQGKTVADALAAALTAQRAVAELRKGEVRRHQSIAKDLEATREAIGTMPEGATKQQVKALLENLDATFQIVVDPAGQPV